MGFNPSKKNIQIPNPVRVYYNDKVFLEAYPLYNPTSQMRIHFFVHLVFNIKLNYNILPQSLSNTLVHIVFSTKHRKELIDDNIESLLFGYVGNICNKQKCKVIIVGGYKNHIHVFCSLHRTVTQSNLVKILKTSSSVWIKTQGDAYENFYWQDGYGVFSVSQSDSSRLIKYIQNQRHHHEKMSFKEEYRKLLKSHNIVFDEKYVWD